MKMKTCPLLDHTIKGRERALKYTGELTKLTSNKDDYTYKLYHYYDEKPLDVYVTTCIQPAVFELLLARILFEASEINECYELGQEEIAEHILKDLYGIQTIEKTNEYDEEFDLYYTWEKWCAVSNKVMELKILDNDSIRIVLAKIITRNYD